MPTPNYKNDGYCSISEKLTRIRIKRLPVSYKFHYDLFTTVTDAPHTRSIVRCHCTKKENSFKLPSATVNIRCPSFFFFFCSIVKETEFSETVLNVHDVLHRVSRRFQQLHESSGSTTSWRAPSVKRWPHTICILHVQRRRHACCVEVAYGISLRYLSSLRKAQWDHAIHPLFLMGFQYHGLLLLLLFSA